MEADYAMVRGAALFEGIPDQDLVMAMTQGGIVCRKLDRDNFVLDPIGLANGQPAPVVYVADGQVAAAVFTEGELRERRDAQLAHENASEEDQSLVQLRPPLARTALKNVALFVQGDLFNSGALQAARGQPIAFYTAAPSSLVSLDHRWVAELAVRHPFFEARLRRALAVSRERLAWVSGVKQELLDFFVRQGMSVSGEMVRVRQLGLCIDCKLCEEACEERYGAQRLTLGGYQLGMLDFVYTCRTCSDQRCVDPCAYDSIKYDEKKKEVVINEATCTGCTACAQSCPYGAIDMIAVEQGDPTFKKAFKKRLDKKNMLQHGPGTPRVAKPRRIANKCDHCMAYGDQACVSACPTGALIEINAFDLFRERSPGMTRVAKTGFEQDLTKKDRKEVLPVMPFTEGVAMRSGGKAKIKRGRYAPLFMWVVGMFAFLVAMAEYFLVRFAPTESYRFYVLRHSAGFKDSTEQNILESKPFELHPGDILSTYVGLVGTGLMVIAAIYPIFRRIKPFRWIASNTMWFDFHLMAGTIGPFFILIHMYWTHAEHTYEAIAFWSMAVVFVSGFLGRYLYTQVPEMSSGVELEELDHERTFQAYRGPLPVAMAEIDRELNESRARAHKIAMSSSVLKALLWLFWQDFGRTFKNLARRGRLRALDVDRQTRKNLSRRAARVIIITRRQVVAPKAQILLHSWKKVHVPFTVLLTVFATLHIVAAWSSASW